MPGLCAVCLGVGRLQAAAHHLGGGLHWRLGRQHGLFIVSTKATPGCQILYDFSGGDGTEPVNPMKTHTGIYIGAGQTIEGNTGMPEGVYRKNVMPGPATSGGRLTGRSTGSPPEPFAMSVRRSPLPGPAAEQQEDDRVMGLHTP